MTEYAQGIPEVLYESGQTNLLLKEVRTMLVYLTPEERRDLARRYRLAYKDADVTFLHQASTNGSTSVFSLDDIVRFRKRTRDVTEEGVIGLLVSMTDERGQRDTFAVIISADDQTGRRQYRVPLGDVTHVSS